MSPISRASMNPAFQTPITTPSQDTAGPSTGRIDDSCDGFDGKTKKPEPQPAPPSDGPAPGFDLEHKIRTIAVAVREKATDVANKAIAAGIKLVGKIQDKLSSAAARINGEG